MNTRCEGCTGETRQACDEVFSDVRKKFGPFFAKQVELGRSRDLAEANRVYEEMSEFGQDVHVRMGDIGCTLDEQELVAKMSAAGMEGMAAQAEAMDAMVAKRQQN